MYPMSDYIVNCNDPTSNQNEEEDDDQTVSDCRPRDLSSILTDDDNVNIGSVKDCKHFFNYFHKKFLKFIKCHF